MRLHNNFNTLLSNLALQTSGFMAILLVPKFLGTIEYGQVTVIATWVSLVPMADLGLSNVYGRLVPGLQAAGDLDALERWNGTILRMRIVGSLLFGMLAGVVTAVRGGSEIIGTLVAILCFASGIAAYVQTRGVSTSQFAIVRHLNIIQAVVRLLTIPGAAWVGVGGWCLGQIASFLALLSNRSLMQWIGQDWAATVDLSLWVKHWREALQLMLTANLWLQLLSLGRLLAALYYPTEEVARYGLANAACQALGALAIAGYLPQTVKVYGLLAQDRKIAVAYAMRGLAWLIGLMAVGLTTAALSLPWFMAHYFPAYVVSPGLIFLLLGSLGTYPVLLNLGTLLVGTGRSLLYITILIGCFIAGVGVEYYARPHFGLLAAALGQDVGGILLALSLCIAVAQLFWTERSGFWLMASGGIFAVIFPFFLFLLK